eukprot:TRINITY_DN13367_c0_g1_i2.p2 TRINITY_DN13367_c0_g1~~TRINITY_DN13367_c0_g1_i2.p2  ORF type:complete len:108 (+),score=26.83 TRINITY_DN13367_c0_g1_i2:84-407(+)
MCIRDRNNTQSSSTQWQDLLNKVVLKGSNIEKACESFEFYDSIVGCSARQILKGKVYALEEMQNINFDDDNQELLIETNIIALNSQKELSIGLGRNLMLEPLQEENT